MSLLEKCYLVALFGDISRENRDRWLDHAAHHPIIANRVARLTGYKVIGSLRPAKRRSLLENFGEET